jgi:hypothetical protein
MTWVVARLTFFLNPTKDYQRWFAAFLSGEKLTCPRHFGGSSNATLCVQTYFRVPK